MSNGIKKRGTSKVIFLRAKKTRQTHGLPREFLSLKERSLQEPTFDTKTCAKSCLRFWHCISHRYTVTRWCIAKYMIWILYRVDFFRLICKRNYGGENRHEQALVRIRCASWYVEVQNLWQSTHKIPMEWLQPTGSQTNLNNFVNIYTSYTHV